MDNPVKTISSDIKTLDEILADMEDSTSADVSANTKKSSHDKASPKKDTQPTKNTKATPKDHIKETPSSVSPDVSAQVTPSKTSKKNRVHRQPSAVGVLLDDVHQSVLDDKSLQLLSQVEIEKIPIPDKATRYLRWLAFYYLSRKELSRHELGAKLIAKGCEATAVNALLDEFSEKGYQSDERCATMRVREAVRKGRGIRHITESLRGAGLDVKDFGGMDALIRLAGVSSVTDGTILADGGHGDTDEIDWLKLAVEARCKKYGDSLPKDFKEKNRQLRFLQYRGFEMDVCFEALKMTLDDFDS